MTVKFGNRELGDGHPCFITYEAGPTFNGIEEAKKLIALSAEAGADAVKFQIVDPERLVADSFSPMTCLSTARAGRRKPSASRFTIS